jgi:DNA-binding SARP family transcriptional activator
MWSLVTLGSLRLVDSSGERLSGRRKELALLAYLARRSPRPTPRAVLAELLWSDRDEDRSRASLRQALSQLRRVLGDVLQAAGDDVALTGGAVELDALALESDAANGRWQSVVSRWNGDFLAGADDLGGEAFHEWLDGERARLRCLAERAFASLVEEYERRGAHRDAADLARRWIDAMPDDERAALALVRAIDLLGEEATADAELEPHDAGPVPSASDLALVDETKTAPVARRRWATYAAGALAVFVVAGATSLVRYTRGATTANLPRMDERQLVLVSDFRTIGTDSVMGDVVSEALRLDLRQSRTLAVYPATQVQEALRQLKRGGPERMDLITAREVAARAGIKAVIDGQVVGSGNRFLLSARLVATVTGAELASYTAEAREPRGILPAVDHLAASLRVRAGEPLRAVDAARPVERVTTTSLEALAKYVRATRAIDLEGAPSKGAALLDEAIALDSTFAMAYRRLAIELAERGGHEQRVRELVQHAFDHRGRLADPERYAVEAAYYSFGPDPDDAKAVAAYEAALEAEPNFGVALNNLSVLYMRRRDFARAESLLVRLIELHTATVQGHSNLVQVEVALGKLDAAERTIRHFEAVSPGNPRAALLRADLLYARGLRDSAAAAFQTVFEGTNDLARRQYVGEVLRDVALVRGKVAEARTWARASSEARRRRGAADAALVGALDDAWIELWFDHDTTGALRSLPAALARYPLAAIPPLDRPYGRLIRLYAWSGQPTQATSALAGYDSAVGEHPRLAARHLRQLYRGQIALAEHRYQDAIAAFRAADTTSCVTCMLPWLATAYDRAGAHDSATVLFSRFAATPEVGRYETDAMFLRMTLERLRTRR